VIGASRYLIVVAVVAIFATALLLVYGRVMAVQAVGDVVGGVSSKGAKALLLSVNRASRPVPAGHHALCCRGRAVRAVYRRGDIAAGMAGDQ
jgi:hypothetical protein